MGVYVRLPLRSGGNIGQQQNSSPGSGPAWALTTTTGGKVAIPPVVTVRQEDEMVALFLDIFMPPGSIQRCSTCQTVFSWYSDFLSRVGAGRDSSSSSSPVFYLSIKQPSHSHSKTRPDQKTNNNKSTYSVA